MEVKSIKSILYQKNGINLDQILFKKNSNFSFSIPERIKKDFNIINKKWIEKDRTNSFKNQDNLCLSKFYLKDKKIFLELCEEKYVTRQTISETVSSLPTIDQDFFLSEMQHQKIKVPISYKINIGLICKDGTLLIVKRSNKVSTNKGKLDFGISKGVKPDDYNGRTFQPIVTAIRALKEELNLSLEIKELIKKEAFKIKEFYLNREIFSIGFLCIIDLRKFDNDYSFSKISDLASGAKNSWEISDFLRVDYNKKSILKLIKDNYDKITNYSMHHLLNILEEL